jgi:beta-mannanase
LWLNGTFGCEQIVAGEMDHQIRKLSNFLQMSNASAIFLRIGYEFDNPFFSYSDSPDTFIKAFQKIVRDLEHSLSLDALLRTQFVWHSWAAPRKENLTLEDFYPGNEFVDWVGISVFQQVFPWPSNWGNGFVDWGGGVGDAEEVLQFAQLKNKVRVSRK